MADTFKFPNNGYDVVVCRKQDILDCIDDNIIDKEVALAIITQCEVDATNFLEEGRWTGIPFLGSIRRPRHNKRFDEINGKEILEDAKKELDEHRYIIFRKELNRNIALDVKRERLYKYMTSCFVTRHKSLFKLLTESKAAEKLKDKEIYARIMCYSFRDLNNYIPIE